VDPVCCYCWVSEIKKCKTLGDLWWHIICTGFCESQPAASEFKAEGHTCSCRCRQHVDQLSVHFFKNGKVSYSLILERIGVYRKKSWNRSFIDLPFPFVCDGDVMWCSWFADMSGNLNVSFLKTEWLNVGLVFNIYRWSWGNGEFYTQLMWSQQGSWQKFVISQA
jgi:hypothetical protein